MDQSFKALAFDYAKKIDKSHPDHKALIFYVWTLMARHADKEE